VLVRDHLNLTGRSPLTGPHFVDLTDAYSQRLRRLAREVDPTLTEGVYAGLPGPHFETPAEIRMLSGVGADLVGMSTVLETIAGRAAGAEVLAVSLVSNLAAGVSPTPLSAEEVLTAGRAAVPRLTELLAGLLDRIGLAGPAPGPVASGSVLPDPAFPAPPVSGPPVSGPPVSGL
jgi:purine-nucleoside phosphorylase